MSDWLSEIPHGTCSACGDSPCACEMPDYCETCGRLPCLCYVAEYALATLAHNLAVAGALCDAFERGVYACSKWDRGHTAWHPNAKGEAAP